MRTETTAWSLLINSLVFSPLPSIHTLSSDFLFNPSIHLHFLPPASRDCSVSWTNICHFCWSVCVIFHRNGFWTVMAERWENQQGSGSYQGHLVELLYRLIVEFKIERKDNLAASINEQICSNEKQHHLISTLWVKPPLFSELRRAWKRRMAQMAAYQRRGNVFFFSFLRAFKKGGLSFLANI